MAEQEIISGFYEPDEPAQKILAAFESGTKGLTGQQGHTEYLAISYWSEIAMGQETRGAGVPLTAA